MARTDTAADAAEHWVTRVRAEQHAASTPLLIVGCAVVVEVAVQFHPFWSSPSIRLYFASKLLPLATFLVLWLVMRVRRARSGLGTGRQGYGGLVLLTLALLVLLPAVTFALGSLLVVGLGLVILGWRGHDRALWMTGMVLSALSPFATLGSFENRARFLGPAPTTVVLVVVALVIIGLGVRRWRAEHRVLAASAAA